MAQWVKVNYCQGCKPESDPQITCGGRRELIPVQFPLTYTYMFYNTF